jgi:hypothetical protein
VRIAGGLHEVAVRVGRHHERSTSGTASTIGPCRWRSDSERVAIRRAHRSIRSVSVAIAPDGVCRSHGARGARVRRRVRRRPPVGTRAIGDRAIYSTDANRIVYPQRLPLAGDHRELMATGPGLHIASPYAGAEDLP